MEITKRAVNKYRQDGITQLVISIPSFICNKIVNNKKSNPYKDASRVLDIDAPTVVDAGAYQGEMTEKFLDLFDDSRIYAIEPLPEHLDILNERFKNNPNVEIFDVALGSENGDIEIQVNPKSNTSSVFKTTSKLQQNREEESDYVATDSISVQQVRLDSIISSCDIMKLDLQGYELEALKGADGLLEQCNAIITEVSFVPYYKSQPLFEELHQYLVDRDFRLYNLYCSSDPSGQITHGDALFLDISVYENESFPTNWFEKDNS
jgi:FkbM family methyltransferase